MHGPKPTPRSRLRKILTPWDDLCVELMTLSEQLHAEGWLTHSEAGGSEEEHGDDYFRTDKTDPAA
jgi:hypothetical protein